LTGESMSKSKSKRLTKEIQLRIWEQARRDELAGKGRDVDYDPPCKYKRKRMAAAKRVECWMMKDARALDVFRDRIRDACDLRLKTHLDLRLKTHLDLPSDSTERMRWYYCFLAAIHDTDLAGAKSITRDIWPEHLLHYMHLPFWAYRGDNTALIEAALECVERDLAKTIAPETTPAGKGSGPERTESKKNLCPIAMTKKDIGLALGLPDDRRIAEQLNRLAHSIGTVIKQDTRKRYRVDLNTIPPAYWDRFKDHLRKFHLVTVDR